MTPNSTLIKTVEQLDYRVTVGDVAAQAGLEINFAQQGLLALASDAGANLQVTDTGEIAYIFPKHFRSILRNKYWRLRWQEAWQKIWKVLFYLIRISFGILLIVSIILIFVAIAVILIALSSSKSSDSNSSSSSSSSSRSSGTTNFIFMPRFWYWDDIFWLFNPYSDYNSYKRKKRVQGDSNKMNFLEAIFSFLFGDGNPNYDLEERRWQEIGAVIKQNQGSIIAEQVAPYFDDLDRVSLEDESYILPVLARFNGYPEVSAAGALVYYFPELQVTTKKRTVFTQESYLQETKWRFSSASSWQILGAISLGVINIVGALVLKVLLQDNPELIGEIEFIGWINSIYWILLGYGTAFLSLPLVRYFWIQGKNKAIAGRNQTRLERVNLLEDPDDTLQHKLQYAQQFSQQHIIDQKDLAYTTETDVIDQELAQVEKLDQEWQRRLEERSSN